MRQKKDSPNKKDPFFYENQAANQLTRDLDHIAQQLGDKAYELAKKDLKRAKTTNDIGSRS